MPQLFQTPPMNKTAVRAVLLAMASALFFTLTYVLNRRAAIIGAHWAWTASLRYLLTLPILALLVALRGKVRPVLGAMRRSPGPWLLWSAVGFVLFYVCLAFAAASGPSWLVAAGFQLTIVAGMLMAPLLYVDQRRNVPPIAFAIGLLIIGGVLIMQLGHFGSGLDGDAWLALGAVFVAAFTYPLGNRKMLLHLEREERRLDAMERVFGMTLASMPLWLVLAAWALWAVGPPSWEQVLLAGGVALSAGVVATVLFFEATARVQSDPTALGAVEAMQGSEIIFATLMGVAFLGEAWPEGWTLLGAIVVILGLISFTMVSARQGAMAQAPSSGEELPPALRR